MRLNETGKVLDNPAVRDITNPNAQKVLDSVRSGEKHYDFIEVMCCPGGCVTGGGQLSANMAGETTMPPYSGETNPPWIYCWAMRTSPNSIR